MDMTVVGLISGTSFDAVETAAARFSLDDQTITMRPLGTQSTALTAPLRARIARCLPPGTTSVEEICQLDTELGQLFAAAAKHQIGALTPDEADLVVSHGQTVYHWVDSGRALGTLQLGQPAWISEATGLPVISDLRAKDIARGGQGAPLATTLDALLLLHDQARRGSLNLGGIANITVRNQAGDVIACDIGPANGLMDSAVADLTNGRRRMDTGGEMAARGTVDGDLLTRLLAEPYYQLPPPKSTGKELFHPGYVAEFAGARALRPDDLLATLAELTARLVSDACREHRIDELVVAGGGLRNPFLMARIADLCAPARVISIASYGIPPEAKEAYLFALLGYLSVHGLDGTIASATGARCGSILGSLTPGSAPLRLPPPATATPTKLNVATA